MRIASTMAAMAFAIVLYPAQAQTPSDLCSAPAAARSAYIGHMIIQQLDRGQGPAAHPLWMREIMLDAEQQAERLADYCDASPETKITTALERLYTPAAAAK